MLFYRYLAGAKEKRLNGHGFVKDTLLQTPL